MAGAAVGRSTKASTNRLDDLLAALLLVTLFGGAGLSFSIADHEARSRRQRLVFAYLDSIGFRDRSYRPRRSSHDDYPSHKYAKHPGSPPPCIADACRLAPSHVGLCGDGASLTTLSRNPYPRGTPALDIRGSCTA